jgi:hypothetical protein
MKLIRASKIVILSAALALGGLTVAATATPAAHGTSQASIHFSGGQYIGSATGGAGSGKRPG